MDGAQEPSLGRVWRASAVLFCVPILLVAHRHIAGRDNGQRTGALSVTVRRFGPTRRSPAPLPLFSSWWPALGPKAACARRGTGSSDRKAAGIANYLQLRHPRLCRPTRLRWHHAKSGCNLSPRAGRRSHLRRFLEELVLQRQARRIQAGTSGWDSPTSSDVPYCPADRSDSRP